MKTGFHGTFVISWSQTEIDGLPAAPLDALIVGSAWAWHGDPVRVDGPSNILRLGGARGSEELRRHAARVVHRLVGAALDHKPVPEDVDVEDAALMDHNFVVTDGAQTYAVTLIQTGCDGGRRRQPLLMFHNALPPRNEALWVVQHSLPAQEPPDAPVEQARVICFAKGTLIRTPDGRRAVEDLREGDLLQTKDDGVQPIEWLGSRIMTGARLMAMPHLRPIRIAAGALGLDQPDHPLIVSPEHRLLLKGPVARDLFNTPEVLVTAKDLVDGQHITIDAQRASVTYFHMLLPRHAVLWANNVETESFHPASGALQSLQDSDRVRLLERCAGVEVDPFRYGGFVRRNLTGPEAAIYRHAA